MGWNTPKRPKVQFGNISSPNPREGSDGDVQIRQTNLGAKLFGKVGGAWYGAPLASTVDDSTTRIGVKQRDHLAITKNSIEMYSGGEKAASFGKDTVITGGTITIRNTTNKDDKLIIAEDSFKVYDNGTEVASFGADVVIGEVGAGKSNVQITAGAVKLRTNTTSSITLDTSGNITLFGKVITGLEDGNTDNNASAIIGTNQSGNHGLYNVQIGPYSGAVNTGAGNTLLGYDSGKLINASYNTCLGGASGVTITSGTYNLCLGIGADVAANDDTHCTAIGYLAKAGTRAVAIGPQVTAADSECKIGIGTGPLVTVFRATTSSVFFQIAYNDDLAGGSFRDLQILASTGQIGYDSSAKLFKTNINTMDASCLYSLNPIEFEYKKKDEDGNYTSEGTGVKEFGLLAEEVWDVMPQICYPATDSEKEKYPELESPAIGIAYKKLIPVLVKAVQELSAKIDTMQTEINNLKAE